MPRASSNTAQEPYWWGRLFVRSASVLAVLVLLVTLVIVLVDVIRLRRDYAATRYAPPRELVEDMEALRGSCQRTADLLMSRFGVSVSLPPPRRALPRTLASERDLEQARAAVDAYEFSIKAMKAAMVRRFSDAVDWLVASLNRKAERIRARIEEEHSAEAEALQERIQSLRAQLDSGGDGLYEALDRAEVRRREDMIDQTLDFLDYLSELSDSASVQSRIDDATGSLGSLKDMLPEPAAEADRLRIVTHMAELRRRLDDLLKQGHKLEGEQLSQRLNTLKSDVLRAVRSSWAVEAHLDRLKQHISAEIERAERLRQARLRRLGRGLALIAGTLGAGLALSFALVVAADVLRALFDIASRRGPPAV